MMEFLHSLTNAIHISPCFVILLGNVFLAFRQYHFFSLHTFKNFDFIYKLIVANTEKPEIFEWFNNITIKENIQLLDCACW